MKHLSLPLLAALATTAFADTGASTPDMVVTDTRLPGIEAPLPNNTVLTRDDIVARQATTLADLLQQEAGITVTSNGGPFTTAGVFLRGSAGKQVLILVDGVRVNDASQGAFDLSLLRADDIERIEIARGPYSAQYGSDAIGGVIQIFTRQSERAEVTVRAGRFNTQEYSAGARAGDGENNLSVRAGYVNSDGFNATLPSNFAYNPDRDGGLAHTAQMSGQTRLSDSVRASFHANWKDSTTEFDQGIADQEFGTASARLEQDVNSLWRQTLQLGWLRNRLDTDGRGDPFSPYLTRFKTERDSASWLHELMWAEGWQTVAGLDYEDESALSRDQLANHTQFDSRLQSGGAFVTQYAHAGIFSGSASLREDDHDSFGRHTTGNVTLSAQVMPTTRLYAGYGSAYRAPSANDLFYPGDPSFCFPFTPGVSCYAGNPNLKPETSRNGEFGVEFRQDGQRIRIGAYRNRVRDLITTSPTFPYPLINESRATLQGIELDADGRVQRVTWRANIGSQSAEDGEGKDLPRRPQGTFNGLVGVDVTDQVNVGTEVRARSTSIDSNQDLGGYTVVNLVAGWKPSPALQLGARLENVANKMYQEAAGYRTPPRSGFLSATYIWR